jgi:hypothetical protein
MVTSTIMYVKPTTEDEFREHFRELEPDDEP